MQPWDLESVETCWSVHGLCGYAGVDLMWTSPRRASRKLEVTVGVVVVNQNLMLS